MSILRAYMLAHCDGSISPVSTTTTAFPHHQNAGLWMNEMTRIVSASFIKIDSGQNCCNSLGPRLEERKEGNFLYFLDLSEDT
jgi:hypothetical protein